MSVTQTLEVYEMWGMPLHRKGSIVVTWTLQRLNDRLSTVASSQQADQHLQYSPDLHDHNYSGRRRRATQDLLAAS